MSKGTNVHKTQFGGWHLEKSGKPQPSRVTSSIETQLPAQLASGTSQGNRLLVHTAASLGEHEGSLQGHEHMDSFFFF